LSDRLFVTRYEPAEFGEYGLILVVLGHAYMIPALKRACTQHYEHGLLNNDNVVDVLQVARLCDVPRLHLLCFRRIVSEFKVVARSEGWRAMRESDPALEQELLDAVIKADRVSPKVTLFVTVVGSDHTLLWACCEKWHVVSS
jgi:hypothetical protein